ncbi:MAG TPA: YceI family protein [Opitutaceae bacterium]|jgi:polyisoprenoid-binding protein YceI
MKIRIAALASAAVALVSAASAAVETYSIDPVHSSVAFEIRHVFSKVPGKFTDFSGTITVDRENLEKSSVTATIQVGSIDTSNEKRNSDLKAPSFFDLAQYSTITFTSTSWKKTGDNAYDVTGNLTIHGITKEVVLKVIADGFGPGMMGSPVSGWEATTTINRRDYGVNGPAMLGTVVGDEVAISINIEADLKK